MASPTIPRSDRAFETERGHLGRAWDVARRWPWISASILTLLVFTAIFADVISPHPPLQHDLSERNLPPAWVEDGSANHLLGTDVIGRDLLSRLMHGTRISLMVAAVALVSGTVIGTGLGLASGYFGGVLDEVITRMVDIWLGLPFILVALAVVVVLGASLITTGILLVLLAWTPFVRQVRAEVLSLKTRDYISAARIAGASVPRIFLRHLLPGVVNTVIVIATLSVGGLILVEAFLSFLGAGIPPPTPAWGSMISDGREYLRDAWWISVFPGLAIFLTVASMNFIGDWIRDYLDPRLRQI
jgi:peptide/nickel transport system permease protein